jgi:hypothetical protein
MTSRSNLVCAKGRRRVKRDSTGFIDIVWVVVGVLWRFRIAAVADDIK